MLNINIDQDENGKVTIQILPQRIQYEFVSMPEALEALPNLEELR